MPLTVPKINNNFLTIQQQNLLQQFLKSFKHDDYSHFLCISDENTILDQSCVISSRRMLAISRYHADQHI